MLTLEHGPASWCDRGSTEMSSMDQGCVVEAGGGYEDSSCTARVIYCIREARRCMLVVIEDLRM